MSLLSKNSTMAERARRCFFAENFKDTASVVKNNGVLSGGAYVSGNNGLVLDGTNDYLTYNFPDNAFNSSEITIFIEFTPDFEADDGATHYFYDSTSNFRYLLFKGDLASYNNAMVYGFSCFAGGNIVIIPYANYAAYWRNKQKNQIMICGASGSTQVYLNGVQISTDATAWSSTKPSTFYVGCNLNFISYFKGILSKIRLFNKKLSAKEAADYYNNTILTYQKDAYLEYPLRMDEHDASSNRTLELSSNQKNLTFGDGSTTTTFPTKLTTVCGYSTDGGDYLKTSSTIKNFGKGEITHALAFKLGAATVATNAILSSYEDVPNSKTGTVFYYISGLGLRFYVGGMGADQSSASGVLSSGVVYIAVGYHDGTNTSYYLDCIKQPNAATPLKPVNAAMSFSLFQRSNVTIPTLTGCQIYYSAFWDYALTPMQIFDLTYKLRRKLKNV